MAGKWEVMHAHLMAGESLAVTGVAEITIRTTLSKLLSAEKRRARKIGMPCPFSSVNVENSGDYFKVKYLEVNYNYKVITEVPDVQGTSPETQTASQP